MFTMPTKKSMTAIARQARQHGYFQYSARDGAVRCPQCRQDVDTYRDIYGDTKTWPKALDAAMLAHLPACTVMLAARDGADVSGAPLDVLADAVDLAPFNSPLQRTLDAVYRARIAADDAAALARL